NVQLNASADLFLNGKGHIALWTPKMWLGQAFNGQVLSLIDQDNGYVDFAALPGTTNIYNNDGTLSSNRLVTLNSKTLTFQGTGNINMSSLGTFDVDAISRAT